MAKRKMNAVEQQLRLASLEIEAKRLIKALDKQFDAIAQPMAARIEAARPGILN